MDGPSPISLRSVGYALLTQTVWLPVIGYNAWDSAQHREFRDALRASKPSAGLSTIGAAQPLWRTGFPIGGRTGTVLNQPLAIARSGVDPIVNPPIRSVDERPGASASEPLFRPYRLGITPARQDAPTRTVAKADPIARAFTRSELLGGSLSLDGLRSPLVPPLALAEQARFRGSGDPYLPLPLSLRTQMRQAIQKLQPARPAAVQQARVANVPSTRVSRPTQVPVAIQSDGSVDILAGVERGAVEDVRDWSRRQPAPPSGSVTPAVVELHPLPAEEAAAPSVSADAPSMQPSALPATSVSQAPAPAAPQPRWTPVPATAVAELQAPVTPPPPVPSAGTPSAAEVLP